jgi:hypothetical protein
MKRLAWSLLCLTVASTSAHAQSVYRCGNLYSESPCPQASILDVSDARSDSQRMEAQRLASNDRQLADQMASERLKRDTALKTSAKTARPKAPKRIHATKIKWFRP